MQYRTFLSLTALFFFSTLLPAAIVMPESPLVAGTSLTVEAFIDLDREGMELHLGRKMKLGERMAFRSTQRQLKRELRAADQDGYGGDTNGMAIAGFVCGVVGLFLFGLILGPLGIIFSAIGLSRSNKRGYRQRGLAIAGLVCGIVAVAGVLIFISTI